MNKDLTIKELTDLIMKQADEKGFGVSIDQVNVAEKIALIHSEVSEAYDAYRHNKFEGKDGFNMELGDIIQRILHLSGILKIDIQKEILNKINMNKDRDWDWKKINEKHV